VVAVALMPVTELRTTIRKTEDAPVEEQPREKVLAGAA
jgi:hypothetical protein